MPEYTVHRSDVRCKSEPITSDKHFRLPHHNFDRGARFTIIEQAIVERNKGDMANFLMTIEDNWIFLLLKTLPGYGLNDTNSTFQIDQRESCPHKNV